MKSMTEPCYKRCINKRSLLKNEIYKRAANIIAELKPTSNVGRPKIDPERALNGIYFVLKTGCQWNSLPRCFGSYSAVHRYFQWLRGAKFFEKMWTAELKKYDEAMGLNLTEQVGDCAITKSPLGGEATGKSPVDRRKRGTKRSVVVAKNSIPIGLAVGPANRNDTKLLESTIQSANQNVLQPEHKKMHLDGIYDDKQVRTILFNNGFTPRIQPNNRRSKQKRIYPYKHEGPTRWVVERSHSWANRFRRVFVRWEKRLDNYVGMLQFAFSISIANKTLI
jgi:putative transposase